MAPHGRTHPPHAAQSHPVVGWLLDTLPSWPGERVRRAVLPDGLYIDGDVGSWRFVKVKREHRQEIARVVSVVGAASHVVGRVELVSEGGPWDVRYVGREGRPYARVDPWWVQILETHYSLGGEPLDLPDPRAEP